MKNSSNSNPKNKSPNSSNSSNQSRTAKAKNIELPDETIRPAYYRGDSANFSEHYADETRHNSENSD